MPGTPDPGLRSGQVASAAGVNLQTLLDSARHRHGPGEGAGLQAGAAVKLVDVEAKIADLTVIAGTHAGQM
ncbi:MAG TPA: hypothetical protein VGD15_17625 [Kribbella sp.]